MTSTENINVTVNGGESLRVAILTWNVGNAQPKLAEIPMLLGTEKELETSIKNNPFFDKDVDINQLHLTFLKEKPCQDDVDKILTYNYEPDDFKIKDKDTFIFCSGKYHQSRLNNNFFEKQLMVGATTRNWKTVMKLSELIKN